MPNLMHRRPAQVGRRKPTTRHRTSQDLTPIGRIAAWIRVRRDATNRQRTDTQQRSRLPRIRISDTRVLQIGLEIDIQRAVRADSKRTLHIGPRGVGSPCIVDGPRVAIEPELDVGGVVRELKFLVL